MENNLTHNKDKYATSHALYEVQYPRGDCKLRNPSYIGHTENTIRIRLTQHKQNGDIIEHLANNYYHNILMLH